MIRVSLRDVTKENWQACVGLHLAPEQEHFVASNAYSLAESKFMPTFVPQAIYARAEPDADETLVGFAMYGYYPDGAPPLGQRHWIFRLMIAQEHQGRGYGTAAMREIIARLEADPACDDVLIGYEPDNTIARTLYARLGFEERGTTPWGELYAWRSTTTTRR
jgi:diamine N-acetyltransferase